jgi:hypothetical protein
MVKEVRKGSIEIDLLAIATSIHNTLLPIMTDACAVGLFIEYVGKTKDWLTGKTKKPEDRKYTIEQIRDFKNIFSPIASSLNENVEIRMIVKDKPVLHLPKKEVMQIIQYPDGNLELNDKIEEPYIETHLSKALFYWYQACFDDSKNTGNKGIISSVDKRPKKVIFQDDTSKAKYEMTTNHPRFNTDWQKVGYIVDVELLLRDTEIVAYKIIDNHLEDAIFE